MKFINENLDRFMEEVDNVLYIEPHMVENKLALYAVIKKREGFYERIQITKEMPERLFSFESTSNFFLGPGYYFRKKFIVIDDWRAINLNYLDEFREIKVNGNENFNIGIYAIFSDNSATFIKRDIYDRFMKQGGIDKYNNLIRQYKECKFHQGNYYVLDRFFGNKNICVVPALLGPTNLEFKEIDYQDLAYKDEDGNAIESEFISSKQAIDAVKQLSKIRDKYNK